MKPKLRSMLKFMARKDHALATIVLAIEPSLLETLRTQEEAVWTFPEKDMG